ncbi:hypothetical protein ACQ4PT_021752 [Festuca glaucescens]
MDLGMTISTFHRSPTTSSRPALLRPRCPPARARKQTAAARVCMAGELYKTEPPVYRAKSQVDRRMEQNILVQILEGSMKPTNLPLETLQEITDGFSVRRIIGEGGFGTVYEGVIGNWNVAVKKIMSCMTINEKLFRREVDSLMEVNHPNIVRFLGFCSHTVEILMKDPESKRHIFVEMRERLLCFEFISNGSLDKKITDELRGLDWDKRFQIIRGICAGLHHLHKEKCILHLDLKPGNILLDNQMMPKITDFGLSRPTENSQTKTTTHFTSPGYTAPENMFGNARMSVKSDMYSLGVIIIELVTGHKGIPVDNNNILRRWRHRWNKSMKETPWEYHQQVTKCIEIGSLCQKPDPHARPCVSEIMNLFVEMKTTNNQMVGEVNLPNWEDDMLGVEPLELQFVYNMNKQILSCSVELINDTDCFIAFDIQATRPLPCSIVPSKDIVKPRSKCNVDITLSVDNKRDHKASLLYGTSNKQYTEEFIVRSAKVSEDLTTNSIVQDMFDKYAADHQVDEILFTVISEQSCSEKATRSCDEALKIGEGQFGCVYKCSLRSTTVAIKLLHPHSLLGQSEFNQEVAVLRRVRHPNLVTLIGSCGEAFSLVYEFLPNGSLKDRLDCTNNTPPLTWQVRTRIISEMCSALIFLHSNKPHPVVHGELKPANVLLDTNLVSKLGDFGICRLLRQSNTSTTRLYQMTTPRDTFAYMDPEFLSTSELTPRSDVYSFGIIILQLLTGRPPQKIAEVVEDAMEKGDLHLIIDPSAGSWPFMQANQLAHLGLQCAEMSRRRRPDLAREVWVVVEPLMKAASLTARRPMFAAASSDDDASTPSCFLCPIFQEMMSDPYIAADGFTYEAEAIRGWLDTGHDTSPMTNLKLAHRELTPNRGLRAVILEWQQQHQGHYRGDSR